MDGAGGRRPELPGASKPRTSRRAKRRARRRQLIRNGAYLAFVVVVVVASVLALRSHSTPASTATADAQSVPSNQATAAPGGQAFQTGPQQGLALTSWAGVTPSPTALTASIVPQWMPDNCLAISTAADVTRCVYGDKGSQKLLAVVGDEMAVSYVPGLIVALPNWRIQLLTYPQCPFVDVPIAPAGDTSADQACLAHQQFVRTQLTALHPQMILTSARDDDAIRRVVGGSAKDPLTSLPAWQAGVQRSVAFLKSITPKVAFVDDPPQGQNLQTCYSPTKAPSLCSNAVGTRYLALANAEKTAAEAAGARYISTIPWFCFQGACPAVIDHLAVFWDGIHLTAPMSASLAPEFKATLPF